MRIKGKQLEDTLRSESAPFDIVYADRTVGDLNGAIRFTALNNSGGDIGAYKVVYINGSSGNLPTIALAKADNAASLPAFGLTASASSQGDEVDVVTFGNIKGVDTSTLSVGDTLFVSNTAGEYTDTPPTGSGSKLQNIGMVVKSDQNGIIKLGGAGRTAATPNLDQGKFFIGDGNNASSESLYTLPLSAGSQGQVLTSNGVGGVTFEDVSGSGGGFTYSAISADPANAQASYHYSCTGTFTITLPTTGMNAGEEIRIKNMGTGTITIDPQTSNIDDSNNDYVLDVQFSAITLVSTGTHWEII